MKRFLQCLKSLFWEGNLKWMMFWGWFVFLLMFMLTGLAVEGITYLHLGEIWATTLPIAPLYIPIVASLLCVFACMCTVSLHESQTTDKGFSFKNLLAGLTPGLLFSIVLVLWRGFI